MLKSQQSYLYPRNLKKTKKKSKFMEIASKLGK